MGSRLDALLKLSVIAAVLFASASVGYYFLVYVPQRDGRLDALRIEEKQRADAAKQAKDEQQVVDQAAAQTRYQSCVNLAELNYHTMWAAGCKRTAEETAASHAHCLAQQYADKANCDSWYRPRDPSPNCALPRTAASDINAVLDKARSLCLQESKAGL